MKLLSIEASQKGFSLALSIEDKVVRYVTCLQKRKIDDTLIPEIKKLLTKAEWNFTDLDAVAVSQGPGSFTSLRVSVSAVKGMGFGTKCKIIAVPSMDVIAANAATSEVANICVVIDARRSMVFSARYVIDQGEMKKLSKDMLGTLDEVLAGIADETLFIGDGVSLYQTEIKKSCKSLAVLADDQMAKPHAKILAKLAWQKVQNKEFVKATELTPLYLYPEDCQVRKK